ncbi:MAG: Nre family DNA repair protein, partial [Candidatus Ranarchaeia archaeon]
MASTSIDSELCLACRGTKLLCGRTPCPILSEQWARIHLKSIPFTSNLSGSSPPAFFVGRQNYPRVLIGPMIPPIFGEEAFILDEPDLWFGKSIEEIIAFRQQLVRTTFAADVLKPNESKLVGISQEIIMGSKPVDTEAKLTKPPQVSLSFDPRISPLGPSAGVESVRITENPKVHPVVERIVGDIDYRATEGMVELQEHGFSVSKINQLLSGGLLGEGKRRKLVPTRWSITATDDTISKSMISRIRDYPWVNQYMVFNSQYLDNTFMILVIPHSWAFEQMEAWMPGSPWIAQTHKPVIITDFEFFTGRKNYADNVKGGY